MHNLFDVVSPKDGIATQDNEIIDKWFNGCDRMGRSQGLPLIDVPDFDVPWFSIPKIFSHHFTFITDDKEELFQASRFCIQQVPFKDRFSCDRKHHLWPCIGEGMHPVPFACRKDHTFHGFFLLIRRLLILPGSVVCQSGISGDGQHDRQVTEEQR